MRRRAACVARYGDPGAMAIVDEKIAPPRGNDVLVRVTHASIGATDVVARQGGYILQPRPGFVTGYDLVGVLETESAVSVALGLRTGMRVAGMLPRMGAHATRIVVPPTVLVAVPDGLDPAVAATAPLDAVTAALAVQLAGDASTILVQGAPGAVGSLAVQLALRDGRTVIGTASARSRDAGAQLGIPLVDYTDAAWPAAVRAAAGGPLGAAIDHTGSPRVSETLALDGTLVHTAFFGRPGHEREDSVRGALAALARRRAHPRERVVAAPTFVLTKRPEYRRMLTSLLDDIAAERLRTGVPDLHSFDELWEAYRAADRAQPGRKVVLAFE